MPKSKEDSSKVSVTYVGERKEITMYGVKFKKGAAVDINTDMFCDATRKIKALPKFLGNPDFFVDHPDNYAAPTHAVRENLRVHIGGTQYRNVKQNINVFVGDAAECEEWIEAWGNPAINSHRVVRLSDG